MANRYLAQEKRVFDISKFTVIGSPTITSDGVLSGITSTSYVNCGQGLLVGANTWEIEFEYDATNMQATGVGTIFSNVLLTPNYSGIVIQGRAGRLSIFGASNTSATWDVFNGVGIYFTPYTKNTFKIGYDGTKYYVLINNVEKWSLESDLKISFPNTVCNIGYHSWFSALVNASIDLNSFKIYVDGQLVFTGTKPVHLLERRKEGFDLSKFTVVGTPTITEDGVASGFSDTNYLMTSKDYAFANANEIIIKTRVGTGSIASGDALVVKRENSINGFISIRTRTGQVYYSPNNGVSSVIITNANIVKLNSELEIIVKIKKENTYIFVKDINSGLSAEHTSSMDNEEVLASWSFTSIGAFSNMEGKFFDLPSFSITVDGKEVFTGAKENYYVLRS